MQQSASLNRFTRCWVGNVISLHITGSFLAAAGARSPFFLFFARKRVRASSRYTLLVLSFMVKSKPKTIEEILKKFEPEQNAIAEKLRSIIKTTLPDASETVRRGLITYIVKGKDFATISLFKDHVDLGLHVGNKLDDKKLKGTGHIRHLKLVSLKSVEEEEITRLLKEAVTLT